MPIPLLRESGLLPPGIYECSLQDAQERFGHGNSRSPLWQKFLLFLERIAEAGIFSAVIIDGRFVTADDGVDDIDVALFVEKFDPSQTEALKLYSSKQVIQEFYEDYAVSANVSVDLRFGENYEEYFQNVKPEDAWRYGGPEEARKGILKVRL